MLSHAGGQIDADLVNKLTMRANYALGLKTSYEITKKQKDHKEHLNISENERTGKRKSFGKKLKYMLATIKKILIKIFKAIFVRKKSCCK